VAARSNTWVFGRSLTGFEVPNSTGGYGCLSVVSMTGLPLIQGMPIECVCFIERI